MKIISRFICFLVGHKEESELFNFNKKDEYFRKTCRYCGKVRRKYTSFNTEAKV